MIFVLFFLPVVCHVQTNGLFTDQQYLDTLKEASDDLFPAQKLTPQEPLWEAPVKKSTTAFHLTRTLDDRLPSQNLLKNIIEPGRSLVEGRRHVAKRSVDFLSENVISRDSDEKLRTRLLGLSHDDGDFVSSKVKRSTIGDRFGNIGDGTENYDNSNDADNEAIWDQSLYGKKTDEGAILKNLMLQDSTPMFGTPQEARDEQNTINEIEDLSRQSSKLPKDLQLPYMNGNLDNSNIGLDFSKMDVKVGRYSTDFDNNGKNSEASFLRRNAVPVTGHTWETRNRDRIPKHLISQPNEMEYQRNDLSEYSLYPKLTRYPAFASPNKIIPSQLEPLESFNAIPPIAPALLSREDRAPSEPIPPREPTPDDEPAPISEFIQTKEPAPIPELPSLREIPPISEQREPPPKDLNSKETFGS